jgi:MFS family permease
VFGRFESFSIFITLYTLGYIQQAASDSVKTFASAQIFYASGSQGLQILQQIFVADSTDLLNRALMSTLFDVPFLWTTWAGGPVAQSILKHSSWRWGYGIWAIALPIASLPLLISLWFNQRKAKKMGLLKKSQFEGMSVLQILKSLWFELDFFGLLLLTAAISLILIPLTLASRAKGGWANGSIIAMLVIGVVSLCIFPLWERSKKLAPHAFFPRELFENRTVLAGTAIAFLYFSKFG